MRVPPRLQLLQQQPSRAANVLSTERTACLFQVKLAPSPFAQVEILV